MTGSLNVRGQVLPIGAVTAKLEAAAVSGIKIALIPESNAKDVLIEDRFYDMMDIYSVSNLRDVLEYALVDCPTKAQYLEKLLPLTPDGKSTARKLERPPRYESKIDKAEIKPPVKPRKEPEPEPEPEPVPEQDRATGGAPCGA